MWKDKKCICAIQIRCQYHTGMKRDNVNIRAIIPRKNNHQTGGVCAAVMSICILWYQIYYFFSVQEKAMLASFLRILVLNYKW
ncbi:hypothetical protein CUN67_06760 [Pantoea cypripedii]|uniref:Uncharacterized protein n=1 Tax=Pantoea cypripedii TaxID=55209 RepID=A0A6B9G8E0_PANCY|nr:hypothetical protein CUN67_06760 [Pantoea cypripedii]